jgi:aspartyl protease family protein
MSQPERIPDPWGKYDEPPEGPSPGRWVIWLLVLVLFGLGIWVLMRAFPGSFDSDFAQYRFLWLIAILFVVSAGGLSARRFSLGDTLRNLLLWGGVVVVLVLGYSFRDELGFIGQRVQSEFMPGYPVATGANELVLTAREDGHFYVVGEANGVTVTFLVDTGASDTVLTPSDAVRLGIDLNTLDFSRVYETANGIGYGADYVLGRLRVGDIMFEDFQVSVNQVEMGTSLLGMSFLNRLASFEFRDRRLFLRSR